MGYASNPAKTMRRICSALTRFENAACDHAFRGSAHPDEWDWIDHRYEQAREMVERVIREELEQAQIARTGIPAKQREALFNSPKEKTNG